MESEFDHIISRVGTSSFKYDGRLSVFGTEEVLPLWVADMDFAAPEAVQAALAERAAHPIYGYSVFPESMYQALIGWLNTRHSWLVQRDWIVMCPGVVPTLRAAIMALTEPGDGIVVQPPIYAPFLAAPEAVGRSLLLNPLKFEDGRYRFDLDDFERCAKEGAKLLLLCSPHNPVGRVWLVEELRALLEICSRYDITIVSDEIHADLVYPGRHHIPLASLNQGGVKIVTAVAPSKTFNIPGLGLSSLIVPEEKDRMAIARAFDMLHISATNPFSITAFEAAYREGATWLDRLMAYLNETLKFTREYLQQHLPRIKLVEPEGTYLLWLDCREMKLDDNQLRQFFVRQAGVGLSPGIIFGESGSGFMRMNIASPRSVIAEALDKISSAERLRQ